MYFFRKQFINFCCPSFVGIKKVSFRLHDINQNISTIANKFIKKLMVFLLKVPLRSLLSEKTTDDIDLNGLPLHFIAGDLYNLMGKLFAMPDVQYVWTGQGT